MGIITSTDCLQVRAVKQRQATQRRTALNVHAAEELQEWQSRCQHQ